MCRYAGSLVKDPCHSPELTAAIDRAGEGEADAPSRSEMIRRIVCDWWDAGPDKSDQC